MTPGRALAAILVVGTVLVVDRTLTQDGYLGGERNNVRDSAARWQQRCRPFKEAEARACAEAGVVLLGSSTSADWQRDTDLARWFGTRRGRVLDAHINGCHQDCTWAQVRRFLQRGRRFATAMYGVNQFQMCDDAQPKRIYQQSALLPTLEIPEAVALYRLRPDTLDAAGRLLGMRVLSVYQDTHYHQTVWGRDLFGRPGRRAWLGARPRAPRVEHSCDYAPESIAYRRAVLEALLDDLGRLADRTFLMMMPDRPLAAGRDPAHLAAWTKHRQLMRALADARPHVHLLDLAVPGEHTRHFRDSIHVHYRHGAREKQRGLLERQLRAGGHIDAR